MTLTAPEQTTAPATVVGRALAVAYSHLPVHFIESQRGRRGKARIEQAATVGYAAALTVLADAGHTVDHLPWDAAHELRALARIANGIDPRGGSIYDQALTVSGGLASALALTFTKHYPNA